MAALLTAATGAYIYNKTQSADQENNYIYSAKSPEQEKEEREINERIWIEQAREQKDREENLRESRLAREKGERRKQVIQAYLAKKTKRKIYGSPSFWKHPIAYTNKYILHKNEHELGLDTCDGVDQQYYKILEEIAEESGATNSW